MFLMIIEFRWCFTISSLFWSVRVCVRMQHIMMVVKLLIKVAVPDVPTGVELSIHRVWCCVTLPDATLIMLCTLHACASKLFFAFIPLRDCISVSPIVTPCKKALHIVHGVLYALCSLLVWHCLTLPDAMLMMLCPFQSSFSLLSHSGFAFLFRPLSRHARKHYILCMACCMHYAPC